MTLPYSWFNHYNKCVVCSKVPGFFGIRMMITKDLLCLVCWDWAWNIGLSYLHAESDRGRELLRLL